MVFVCLLGVCCECAESIFVGIARNEKLLLHSYKTVEPKKQKISNGKQFVNSVRCISSTTIVKNLCSKCMWWCIKCLISVEMNIQIKCKMNDGDRCHRKNSSTSLARPRSHSFALSLSRLSPCGCFRPFCTTTICVYVCLSERSFCPTACIFWYVHHFAFHLLQFHLIVVSFSLFVLDFSSHHISKCIYAMHSGSFAAFFSYLPSNLSVYFTCDFALRWTINVVDLSEMYQNVRNSCDKWEISCSTKCVCLYIYLAMCWCCVYMCIMCTHCASVDDLARCICMCVDVRVHKFMHNAASTSLRHLQNIVIH